MLHKRRKGEGGGGGFYGELHEADFLVGIR